MFELAAAGLGLIGNIGKMFARKKANKEMNKLISEDPAYVENPIAKQRLGLATTLLNARMPGSAAVERNIYRTQANQLGRLDRTATDASQALEVASGIGADTNDAFNELGINEAQDYQRRFGNVVRAQEGVINEQDKVFQDNVRRFGNKVQLKGGQAANRANNWGDLSNMGFALADFGAAGGFQNFFNRSGGASNTPTITRDALERGGQLERTIPRNFRIPR